jgi:hypothetical protein
LEVQGDAATALFLAVGRFEVKRKPILAALNPDFFWTLPDRISSSKGANRVGLINNQKISSARQHD